MTSGREVPMPASDFSPEVAREYDTALRVLYRRHRLGGLDARPPGDHKSVSWNEYGQEHPGVVSSLPATVGGEIRKPGRPHPYVSLCVTNEELQDFIVERWDGKRGPRP